MITIYNVKSSEISFGLHTFSSNFNFINLKLDDSKFNGSYGDNNDSKPPTSGFVIVNIDYVKYFCTDDGIILAVDSRTRSHKSYTKNDFNLIEDRVKYIKEKYYIIKEWYYDQYK